MSEPLKKYWVNKHSMVDEHSPMRTSSDIPMCLTADVEPILNDCAGTMKELVQVITNALPQIKGALIRQDCELAITEAQRLLAELEGKP